MNKVNAPFQRMVVLGDSNAYGMCAYNPKNEWPQVAANWLRKFQQEELEVLNRSIPGNVISPRCPGYELSCKPSLLERFRKHCIDLSPDLVIIAQSLNDARTGMSIQEYTEDLELIVTAILSETNALVVLMGVYHQIQGRGFNDPEDFPWAAKWDQNTLEVFNFSISRVAKRNEVLFVDILNIMSGTDWLLHPDCVHMNDLGHILIGNALFQTIVTHCDGVADRLFHRIADKGVSVENSGGTDTSEDIREIWNMHSQQNPELLSR
ncbi:MAG: SGNH/GDSL hydrolase family protein [Anaerolineales bacterium]